MGRLYSVLIMTSLCWVGIALASCHRFDRGGSSLPAGVAYDLSCDPCWNPPCVSCDGGGITILGEYLFLQPHLCGLNYALFDDRPATAITLTENSIQELLPSGKELGTCGQYTSAFRIGASFLFNHRCSDLTILYTRLWERDTSSAFATGQGGLWMTNAHPRYANLRLNNAEITSAATGTVSFLPDTSQADLLNAETHLAVRTEYNAVDGILGSRCRQDCRFWTRRSIGLRWTEVSVREEVDYQGVMTELGTVVVGETPPPAVIGTSVFLNATVAWGGKTSFWGIGPRIGWDVHYDLACRFGIGMQMGASILVGERSQRRHEVVNRTNIAAVTEEGVLDVLAPLDVAEESKVNQKHQCRLVPEWDARLGLNYLFCCGECFSLIIEVGWEFVSYINALGYTRLNDIAGTERQVCESFNLDGLYVSLQLGF